MFLLLALTGQAGAARAQRDETVPARRLARPDPGLRRGAWWVPGWVPWAGGGALLALATGALVYRFARAIRDSRRSR